ncbi:MAG TPA: hypothetical protein VGD65_08190 [Chryseosolibacter sp.]
MKRITLILLLAPFSLAAQEDSRPWMARENRIGLSIGIGTHRFLDQNTSPLIYQSKPKNVRLFYQLESKDLVVTFDVDVKMGGLQPKNNPNRMLVFEEEDYKGKKETKKFPAGGSFLGAKVSLGAFYKIRSTQESTFKVAAGLSVTNELLYPQGWTSSGMMNALSFAPKALVQHRINNSNKVTASMRLPVVARVTRLPYHNSVSHPESGQVSGFFKNSQWTSLGHFLAPDLSIGYEYLFSSRWGTGLTYDLNWHNVTTENQFKALSHYVRANIYHQF